jgi:predicted nucleotidyltransferase
MTTVALPALPQLSAEDRALLQDLCDRIVKAVGDRIHAIKLFGSRARGDAQPDSDYDVLVVIEKDDFDLSEQIGSIAYDVYWDDDFRRYLSVKVMSRDHYAFLGSMPSSFFLNVEEEAVSLWTRG